MTQAAPWERDWDYIGLGVFEAGGLLAQADMARRYGVSPSVVSSWVKEKRFPTPLGRVATKTQVWLVAECDRWVRRHNPQHAFSQGDQRGGEEDI